MVRRYTSVPVEGRREAVRIGETGIGGEAEQVGAGSRSAPAADCTAPRIHDAVGSPDHRPIIQAPRRSDPWAESAELRVDRRRAIAAISGKEIIAEHQRSRPPAGCGVRERRIQEGEAILHFDVRLHDVVAQTQVQRESRADLEIVAGPPCIIAEASAVFDHPVLRDRRRIQSTQQETRV